MVRARGASSETPAHVAWPGEPGRGSEPGTRRRSRAAVVLPAVRRAPLRENQAGSRDVHGLPRGTGAAVERAVLPGRPAHMGTGG